MAHVLEMFNNSITLTFWYMASRIPKFVRWIFQSVPSHLYFPLLGCWLDYLSVQFILLGIKYFCIVWLTVWFVAWSEIACSSFAHGTFLPCGSGVSAMGTICLGNIPVTVRLWQPENSSFLALLPHTGNLAALFQLHLISLVSATLSLLWLNIDTVLQFRLQFLPLLIVVLYLGTGCLLNFPLSTPKII